VPLLCSMSSRLAFCAGNPQKSRGHSVTEKWHRYLLRDGGSDARCRLQRAPCRSHHGTSPGRAWLPTHESIRRPMARAMSCASLNVAAQPDVLGEFGYQTILLPQVPQPWKPIGTMGSGSQNAAIRSRRRPLSRPRPRSPQDRAMVTPRPYKHKRRRPGMPRTQVRRPARQCIPYRGQNRDEAPVLPRFRNTGASSLLPVDGTDDGFFCDMPVISVRFPCVLAYLNPRRASIWHDYE
jgi:hypothetical protein